MLRESLAIRESSKGNELEQKDKRALAHAKHGDDDDDIVNDANNQKKINKMKKSHLNMLMKYERFEKLSLLSNFLRPMNQSKDRIRLRNQNKDYLKYVAEPVCVNYEISRSSVVFSTLSEEKNLNVVN